MFLCEICKKNYANVHMTQVINGEKYETYICEECLGDIESENIMPLQNLFHGLMEIFADQLENQEDDNFDDLTCDQCGYEYSDFKNSNEVGCVFCYETFKFQIDKNLKKAYASNHHIGKIPKKHFGDLISKNEIEDLKKQMKIAVSKEDFSKAAKFRDMIKNLEGGNTSIE